MGISWGVASVRLLFPTPRARRRAAFTARTAPAPAGNLSRGLPARVNLKITSRVGPLCQSMGARHGTWILRPSQAQPCPQPLCGLPHIRQIFQVPSQKPAPASKSDGDFIRSLFPHSHYRPFKSDGRDALIQVAEVNLEDHTGADFERATQIETGSPNRDIMQAALPDRLAVPLAPESDGHGTVDLKSLRSAFFAGSIRAHGRSWGDASLEILNKVALSRQSGKQVIFVELKVC